MTSGGAAASGGGQIRVLIVDDEPAARRGVELLLERQAGFTVVGQCADGAELLHSLPRLQPDLVFLDIQMPGMDAFEALRQVAGDDLPLVIFVSAYDRYAIRAFETHAVDYLLKPVGKKRFAQACERARASLQAREAEGYTGRLIRVIEALECRVEGGPARRTEPVRGGGEGPPTRFVARSHHRLTLIVPDDILWVGSARDYVRLHTAGGSHLVRETMAGVCDRLDPGRFVRVHRTTIVRLDAVREFRFQSNGKLEVVLPDGETRPVSRSGRKRLQDALGFEL